MLNSIFVEICAHCSVGELIPAYDHKADILVLGSNIQTEWLYGLDVNGSIIIDLTPEKIVTNIDLLISRSLWKVSKSISPYIPTAKKKSVKVKQESVLIKSFSDDLEIITNAERSLVQVYIGKKTRDLEIYSLSEKCAVFIANAKLAGFQAILGA